MKFEYFWGLKTYVRTWHFRQMPGFDNCFAGPGALCDACIRCHRSGAIPSLKNRNVKDRWKQRNKIRKSEQELAIQAAFHGGRSYILSSLHELFTAPWRSHKSRRGLLPEVFKMESHHHEYDTVDSTVCYNVFIYTYLHTNNHDVNNVVFFFVTLKPCCFLFPSSTKNPPRKWTCGAVPPSSSPRSPSSRNHAPGNVAGATTFPDVWQKDVWFVG